MRFLHYDQLESTNDEAKRLFRTGAVAECICVVAREQTAGRGTWGRSWASPADAGIYMTVAQHAPVADLPATTLFTLAAGVACADVIRRACGVAIELKPVNDLYHDGCKLGGILTEAQLACGSMQSVVTGIGINVRKAPRTLPADAPPATSLQAIMPADAFGSLDIAGLIHEIAHAVEAWNCEVFKGHTERVAAAWQRHKMPGTELPPSFR